MSDYYVDKFKNSARGKIWIAIDAANLEQSVRGMFVHPRDVPEKLSGADPATLKWSVDYRALKEFFTQNSDVERVNFYTARFETESHEKFLTFMKKQGYRLITKTLKPYPDHHSDRPHRKANFDVELSVDAVYNISQYETLILFSGDSDFEYFAKFLREKGKKVILFSHRGHTAKELFSAIDSYFDIVDFRFNLLRMYKP